MKNKEGLSRELNILLHQEAGIKEGKSVTRVYSLLQDIKMTYRLLDLFPSYP